jgi:hypothetical protein
MRKTINRARVCVCISGLRVVWYVCVSVYIVQHYAPCIEIIVLMFCTLHSVIDKYIIPITNKQIRLMIHR